MRDSNPGELVHQGSSLRLAGSPDTLVDESDDFRVGSLLLVGDFHRLSIRLVAPENSHFTSQSHMSE